jgi:hypothetical protein
MRERRLRRHAEIVGVARAARAQDRGARGAPHEELRATVRVVGLAGRLAVDAEPKLVSILIEDDGQKAVDARHDHSIREPANAFPETEHERF